MQPAEEIQQEYKSDNEQQEQQHVPAQQEQKKKQQEEEKKNLTPAELRRQQRKQNVIKIDKTKFEQKLEETDMHHQAVQSIYNVILHLADPFVHFYQESDIVKFWGRAKTNANDLFVFPCSQKEYYSFVMRDFRRKMSDAIPGETPENFKIFTDLELWGKDNCAQFWDQGEKAWMKQLSQERSSNQSIKNKIYCINPSTFYDDQVLKSLANKFKILKSERAKELQEEGMQKEQIEIELQTIDRMIEYYSKAAHKIIDNEKEGQKANYYVKLFVFADKEGKDISVALVLMLSGVIIDIGLYNLRYTKFSSGETYYFTKHAKDIFSYIDKAKFQQKMVQQGQNHMLDLMFKFSSMRSITLLPNSFGTAATNQILKRCDDIFDLIRENDPACKLKVDDYKTFLKTEFMLHKSSTDKVKLGKRLEHEGDEEEEGKGGEKRQAVAYDNF